MSHVARRFWLGWAAVFFAVATLCAAAESLPPKPDRYFNDYAHIVSPGTAESLNHELADFERATSNQILVAIYPRFTSSTSVDDFAVRTAQSWHVGQAGRNNGAVLFVFVQDRKIFISVGYGLEGALPDATCFQIIQEEIQPRFRAGDYPGGLKAGIEAMMAATRGEYQGTGRTHAESGSGSGINPFVIFAFIAAFYFIGLIRNFRRRRYYTGSGVGSYGGYPPTSGGGFFSGGGGGIDFGGSSGGGSNDSFSSGGGSFGGGGAGGSW